MSAIIPAMRLAVATLVLCAVVAGCGGGEDPAPEAEVFTQTTERRPSPAPAPAPGTSPLEAPASVPREGTEAADPEQVDVLARWLKALREGRDDSAARLFALPSKVQNGTPVLTLKTEVDRFVFGHTLPCGAKIDAVKAARGYLVVEYVLTERVGGDCGSGVGGRARGAVKVVGGKITEWYRLPEAGGGDPAPSTPPVQGFET